MFIALCVVVGIAAAGGVASYLIASGGDGGAAVAAMPTTGAFAPIRVPKPLVSNGITRVDPDSMIRGGADLQMVTSRAPGTNHYRVTITNASGLGYIDSFQWFPPTGTTIVKVTGSSVGHCDLEGTSGLGGSQFQTVLLNPNISCSGVHLKPPSCTCQGDGGQVVVSFVATADVGYGGAVRVLTATPVYKPIPSYVQTPDESVCAKNQESTAAAPCISGK